MNAVDVRELSLWYGTFQALDRVSMSVKLGEIVALIGPSGCCKSTLLRCMNRMNDMPGVRITGGLDVGGYNALSPQTDVLQLRRDVGMVFQRPNPLPMSVRENVLFGLKLHAPATSAADREVALESALREVALWDQVKDALDRPGEHLSLEGRQKLCIARLLPLKPRVLLMDEPCSALDPEGIAAVEELMARLRGRYTLVVVTHTMQQARRVSDTSMFLYMGEMVEIAPTADLFTSPRDERTSRYVEGRFG